MTPSECRDYLGRLQHFGIKLGLENVTTLCAALGNPQNQFLSIHVAGTNGKGSVSAMLAGIMRAHGLRTGLYTSPHLARVEERIRVDGKTVAPARFRDLLTRLKGVIDGLMAGGRLVYHPTYFEVLTALAFLQFAECEVDVAVLEVGMGGRFDATNVVRPLVSVITTIARDHEEHLGSTLEKIAFEKAGIVKPRIPAVCGVAGGPALRVIRRAARERGAALTEVFGRGRTLETARVRDGYRFVYSGENGRYAFTPGLAGRHQGINAAVAIATTEVLVADLEALRQEQDPRSHSRDPLGRSPRDGPAPPARPPRRGPQSRGGRGPGRVPQGRHPQAGRPGFRGHAGQRPAGHDPFAFPADLSGRPDTRPVQALRLSRGAPGHRPAVLQGPHLPRARHPQGR